MKVKITLIVLLMFMAGLQMASASDVMDLSTLGKKPVIDPVALPRISSTMPTSAGQAAPAYIPLDLSTLGKVNKPVIDPTVIKGPTPITITPMFSIRNGNITSGSNTVVTPAHALRGPDINYLTPRTTVYTPPIAIFGGA